MLLSRCLNSTQTVRLHVMPPMMQLRTHPVVGMEVNRPSSSDMSKLLEGINIGKQIAPILSGPRKIVQKKNLEESRQMYRGWSKGIKGRSRWTNLLRL